MCELLGLAFNEPVTAEISFRGFRHRGAANPDGWGLAWFEDAQLKLVKESASADTSAEALALQKSSRVSSPIVIGHVRLASRGEKSDANTHPFCREFQGSPVAFAHNGTLELSGLNPAGGHIPLGETDSEKAFCLLLSWMEEYGVQWSDHDRIENWLRELNSRGNMNLLFSNGREFFAYRDFKGYNGLCLARREAPFASIKLRDEDWAVDLAEVKKPSERGFILATRRLTDERWTEILRGRLLVVSKGSAVFGNPLA